MESIGYQIATLIISIIGIVLARVFVPWLATKVSNEKLLIVEMWVNIAVAAAEQMKAAGIINVDKKDYVVRFVRDKGVTITDQELDALIEAAVYEINKAKYLLFKNLDKEQIEEVDQV